MAYPNKHLCFTGWVYCFSCLNASVDAVWYNRIRQTIGLVLGEHSLWYLQLCLVCASWWYTQVCILLLYFLSASPSITERRLLKYLTEIIDFSPILQQDFYSMYHKLFFLSMCIFRIIVPSFCITSLIILKVLWPLLMKPAWSPLCQMLIQSCQLSHVYIWIVSGHAFIFNLMHWIWMASIVKDAERWKHCCSCLTLVSTATTRIIYPALFSFYSLVFAWMLNSGSHNVFSKHSTPRQYPLSIFHSIP